METIEIVVILPSQSPGTEVPVQLGASRGRALRGLVRAARALTPTIMHKTISQLDQQLRHEIEVSIGFSLKTPRDFEHLCATVFEQQHVHISVSTLKRYWGYVRSAGNYRPNRYTLRILTRFAGYADWEAFERGEKLPVVDNGTEKQRLLDASLSKIGESLNNIYNEMEAIKREMERMRSLADKAETDAAFAPADVAHGD